jgi:hypothetical protein
MKDKGNEPIAERDDQESGRPVQLDKDKPEQKERPQHVGQPHQPGQQGGHEGGQQAGGGKK